MINNEPHSHKGGLIAAVISAVGAALFFLWQPIMDYFVTGTYDDNIVLQIEAKSLHPAPDETVLGIQVKAINKGNVPVKLISQSQGDLSLEVRRVEKNEKGAWINPLDNPVIAKKTLIDVSQGEVRVAPSSYLSREAAIPLTKGVFWIEVTLHKKDSESLTESTYFQLDK
jgi:hypothetical protein